MLNSGKLLNQLRVLFLVVIASSANWAFAAGVLYKNDFESGLGVLPDRSDVVVHPKSATNENDIRVVSDPLGGASKVMRTEMCGDAKCANEEPEPGLFKHRALLEFGRNVNNAPARGNGLRFVEGVEYWIGYKTMIDPVSAKGYEHLQVFWLAIAGGQIGEPVALLKGNNKLNVIPERYKDENKEVVEKKSSTISIAPGQWHDVVVRLIREPYRVGVAANGTFQMWLDNVLIVSHVGNIYTGTDQVAFKGNDPVLRLGVYWGEEHRPGSTYIVYFDNLTVAEGANGFDTVNPQFGSTDVASPPMSPQISVE